MSKSLSYLKEVLGAHSSDDYSFEIHFNPHRMVRQTVTEHVKSQDITTGRILRASQELVTLKWYRMGPGCYLHFGASSFDDLVDYVESYINEDKKVPVPKGLLVRSIYALEGLSEDKSQIIDSLREALKGT